MSEKANKRKAKAMAVMAKERRDGRGVPVVMIPRPQAVNCPQCGGRTRWASAPHGRVAWLKCLDCGESIKGIRE